MPWLTQKVFTKTIIPKGIYRSHVKFKGVGQKKKSFQWWEGMAGKGSMDRLVSFKTIQFQTCSDHKLKMFWAGTG